MMKIYDDLLSSKPTITLEKACSVINGLKGEELEIIYALILHHAYLEKEDINKPPYKITTLHGGKGLLVELDKLPKKLQRVILNYIENITG